MEHIENRVIKMRPSEARSRVTIKSSPHYHDSSPRLERDFSKWLCEEMQLAKATIETKVKNLRRLKKRVNIWDMDVV